MKKYTSFITIGGIALISTAFFVAVAFAQSLSVLPVAQTSSCASIIQTNLSYGMNDSGNNTSVSALQQFLNSNGYLHVQPTGYFGSMTETAVISFQGENGVPATGYVGPLTRAALQKYPCSGAVGTSSLQPVQPLSGTITVTSPISSTTLVAGTYENITWNQTPPVAPVSSNLNNYDVTLVSNGPNCIVGQACPMYALASVPIAYAVFAHGNYTIGWPWVIASSTPAGQYRVQVCVSAMLSTTASQECGESGTFSIVDSTTTSQ